MTPGYDALGFYHDPEDPRLIVPKRNPALGWTINLSHRYGMLVLMATLAVAIVPAVLAILALPLHRR